MRASRFTVVPGCFERARIRDPASPSAQNRGTSVGTLRNFCSASVRLTRPVIDVDDGLRAEDTGMEIVHAAAEVHDDDAAVDFPAVEFLVTTPAGVDEFAADSGRDRDGVLAGLTTRLEDLAGARFDREVKHTRGGARANRTLAFRRAREE